MKNDRFLKDILILSNCIAMFMGMRKSKHHT